MVRTMSIIIRLMTIFAIWWGGAWTGAHALQPTPPPPPAADCMVPPRTPEELRGLLGVATPGRRAEPREAIGVLSALPTGTPADADTSARVTQMVTTYATCLNAGDVLRATALFTNRYLALSGPIDPATLDEMLTASPEATPEPVNVWVAEIQDVLVLTDGRISAIVTVGGLEDEHPAPGRVYVMLFTPVEGTLLIDDLVTRIASPDTTEVLSVADALAPSHATPMATP